MNTESDYYSVLGILPDAEGVVVVAAYRALASLYHPDKWKGDVTESTRRMADINVAYGVLSDPAKRKAYDATRKTSHSSFEAEDDQRDAAFDSALTELEVRWQVAVSIYPDLADIRKHLSKTAHRLAFAFVTVMLETKQFANRHSVADRLEKAFLMQHFGTNEAVIAFAKELIQFGRKDAILVLNQYVDVIGSSVDPAPLISKVEKDFKISENRRIKYLRSLASTSMFEHQAKDLAALLGYDVTTVGMGFFKAPTYEVRLIKSNQKIATMTSSKEFMKWVLETLCT